MGLRWHMDRGKSRTKFPALLTIRDMADTGQQWRQFINRSRAPEIDLVPLHPLSAFDKHDLMS